MRGGVFHEFMLDRLEEVFLEQGLDTTRQVPSRCGRATGYIDLVASDSTNKLLIEVEMCAKRVASDLEKLVHQGPKAALWIVTPNQRVQKAISDKLQRLQPESKQLVYVLSFGTAIQVAKHIRTLGNLGVVDQKTENNNHK